MSIITRYRHVTAVGIRAVSADRLYPFRGRKTGIFNLSIMNYFEEYKKIYMRLKEDHLKAMADHASVTEASKIMDMSLRNMLYKMGPLIKRGKHTSFNRLKYVARCLFDMSVPCMLCRTVNINGFDERLNVAIDMTLMNDNESIYNNYFVININMLRDFDYYSRIVTNESILGNIRMALLYQCMDNLHHTMSLLDNHLRDKDLKGSDKLHSYHRIMLLREEEVIDNNMKYLQDSVQKFIDEILVEFQDEFNKLSDE